MAYVVATITIPQLHERFRAQGVSAREHIAFRCVVCSTVQSIASLVKAGCDPSDAERYVGFSCIGRITNAGPWQKDSTPGRGCDWTLGGLFRVHKLEVIDENGKTQPIFEVATPDEAQALEHALLAEPVVEMTEGAPL